MVVDPFKDQDPNCYLVRINLSGSSTSPFNWQIIRTQDSVVIKHSARTFETLVEALVDSANVAASLALEVNELQIDDSLQARS